MLVYLPMTSWYRPLTMSPFMPLLYIFGFPDEFMVLKLGVYPEPPLDDSPLPLRWLRIDPKIAKTIRLINQLVE